MWLLPFLPILILAAPLTLTGPEFDNTVQHLHRFGYLGSTQPSLHEFRTALKAFQEVAGVEVTGELDEDTVRATRRPRCAQPDTHTTGGRRKRYAFPTKHSQAKWDKSHYTGPHELTLKWHVSQFTKDLSEKVIRSTIHKAFQLWSGQSNLKMLPKMTFRFEEVSSKEEADIDILWAEGDHGDAYQFDGARSTRENILAHTFFPGLAAPLNGDIHFDDAETWEVDPKKTEDSNSRFFPYVLAHEIGHALGLQHSRKTSAVMSPYYNNTPLDQLNLDIDDKCGINWNYVGPSNFCLFVWLMSEIVPLHNDSDMHGSVSSSDHVLPGNHRVKSKRILKNVRIPRCTNSNDLQSFAARKLHRNLHFPSEEARKYSDVVCNFLAGLHVYRGGPNYSSDDSIVREFHGVNKEVSEFGPVSSNSIRRLARRAERKLERNVESVFDPSYFNEEFFDGFLPAYLRYSQ